MKPGDFVSYYAKATDNNAAEGAKTTTSDIYFVNVRPFRKDFKPAQSQAGGGGGGGGGDVGQLSEQQRQIVAATFNTVRDKPKLSAEKYRENVVFLNLAQAKLRAQVDELVGKLQARVGVVDPGFKAIAEALPKASAEMKTAEGNLKAQQAKEALSPEQRALKLLQDAEQNYEMQVRQGGGGGGGGGQSQLSEDLADLFELELDKLANQYEMQKRAEQQSGDQKVDELAEKLKDLARRQQQEAERQRRMAASGQQNSGGGGGGSQRQLADELEEAARRLEQLTREQQRQDLSDAAKQMRDAAQAMRQAAANGSRDGGAQATAALDKLRQAQQKLERNQGDRAQRDIESARQQAEALANEQKQVASDVNGLEGAQAGADRQQKAQNLAQRKEAMDAKVGQLQKDLEQIANETRRDQKDASRKLEEAAGTIRDKRVREKIRYSRAQLGGTPSDYAKAMEDDIGANLDALQRKIGEAGSALGNQSKKDALGRAADKAGDLVRNLQSINERMRQQQAQERNGQQGQRNGQNQQGQQGQQGSRASRTVRVSKASRVSRPRTARANRVNKASKVRVSKGNKAKARVSRGNKARVRASRVSRGRAARVSKASRAAMADAWAIRTAPTAAARATATTGLPPASCRSTRTIGGSSPASSASGRATPSSCAASSRPPASTRATSTT